MPTPVTAYDQEMVLKVLRYLRKTPSGCIEWTGITNGVGYGIVHSKSRRFYVHRLTYIETAGPIPEGLVIDHLCRNTLCCNPAHLEAVTPRENVLRGAKGLQTHCIHGHPFDQANTYITYAGARMCRACCRRRSSERRARIRDRRS